MCVRRVNMFGERHRGVRTPCSTYTAGGWSPYGQIKRNENPSLPHQLSLALRGWEEARNGDPVSPPMS